MALRPNGALQRESTRKLVDRGGGGGLIPPPPQIKNNRSRNELFFSWTRQPSEQQVNRTTIASIKKEKEKRCWSGNGRRGRHQKWRPILRVDATTDRCPITANDCQWCTRNCQWDATFGRIIRFFFSSYALSVLVFCFSLSLSLTGWLAGSIRRWRLWPSPTFAFFFLSAFRSATFCGGGGGGGGGVGVGDGGTASLSLSLSLSQLFVV